MPPTRKVRAIKSPEDIRELLSQSKPLAAFKPGLQIAVSDKMQSRYTYELTEPVGKNFAPEFKPAYTPDQMLKMGVFEGKYMNDEVLEFPREWYEGALAKGKLSPQKADPSLNEFGIKSRQSLQKWRRKGWIPAASGDKDVRGWFQWYCRYYIGRRDPAVDDVQIKRWKNFARHEAQVVQSAERENVGSSRAEKRKHRPRQRQALLQWARNAYV